MKSQSQHIANKLTLSGVIRHLDTLLASYRQSFKSPQESLYQIVEGLETILIDRCSYKNKKGKNKHLKCLRPRNRIKNDSSGTMNYIGDRCKCHIEKNSTKTFSKTPSTIKSGEINSSEPGPGAPSQNIEPEPTPKSTDSSASNSPKKQVLETQVNTAQIEVVGEVQLTILPKEPANEYYSSPCELKHLYNNVYLDSTNVVVLENNHSNTEHRWSLVCKYSKESGALKRFSPTVVLELRKQKNLNFYNYNIKEEFIGQIVLAKVIQALERGTSTVRELVDYTNPGPITVNSNNHATSSKIDANAYLKACEKEMASNAKLLAEFLAFNKQIPQFDQLSNSSEPLNEEKLC